MCYISDALLLRIVATNQLTYNLFICRILKPGQPMRTSLLDKLVIDWKDFNEATWSSLPLNYGFHDDDDDDDDDDDVDDDDDDDDDNGDKVRTPFPLIF